MVKRCSAPRWLTRLPDNPLFLLLHKLWKGWAIKHRVHPVKLSPREPAKKRRILGPLGYLYVGTKWFITKLFVIRSGEP